MPQNQKHHKFFGVLRTKSKFRDFHKTLRIQGTDPSIFADADPFGQKRTDASNGGTAIELGEGIQTMDFRL